jgi:hypothetical protein
MEQVCLCEQNQVLVTIQLPNYFVISGAPRVKIRDEPKIIRAGLLGIDVIATPLDLRPGVQSQAEQRKTVRANFAG